ncbi:hypothetical protein AKG11_25140 [Shinella sp. SUS2]|uniref:hypothetical protein n=1 Tax=unclassified Shinella TaxID=2643062 RepID=UPI000682413D|nr:MULTISPECIES: hypothetical protein [unclassified Shinella]KNY14192.1 hypothetical protein AKG11_25140 [Shinella sp. SUS2]KOC73996.1 hypothetical protein AKG10_19145 [Shinella sp. GWS1]
MHLVATIAAAAIHFKPRTFIIGTGPRATLGLLAVGLTSNARVASARIGLSDIGGSYLSPATLETIEV